MLFSVLNWLHSNGFSHTFSVLCWIPFKERHASDTGNIEGISDTMMRGDVGEFSNTSDGNEVPAPT
jgi:hypothetical protein